MLDYEFVTDRFIERIEGIDVQIQKDVSNALAGSTKEPFPRWLKGKNN